MERLRSLRWHVSVALLVLVMAPASAFAQAHGAGASRSTLVTIGSSTDDRIRLAEVLGHRLTSEYTIRAPSTITTPLPTDSAGGSRWSWILPAFWGTWNSHLPFSINDGSAWAGRGATVRMMGGIHAVWGSVSLILAPEAVFHENRDFHFLHYPKPDRSPYAAPWEVRPLSIDLPTRFGDEPFGVFSAGQSSLTVDLGRVAVGAATENLWWGPGIRNAIVMSNHAGGVPHLFLRTTEPLNVGVGMLEGRLISGRLSESPVFDRNSSNDHRSLNAVAVAFRPAVEPDLTLGFTRAVYAPIDAIYEILQPWQVVSDVGRTFSRPVQHRFGRGDPDEIFSLFGRWIFPVAGFESYVEWARHERPASLREFLVEPDHTQGYTLGIQWVRPVLPASVVRLQGEVTYLEQSATSRNREVGSYYTSAGIPQGYTHLGQSVGASIGPGASSQWIAVDYLEKDWEVGGFIGRIRWNNDVFYRSGTASFLDHDVSVFGGGRGGVRLPWGRLDVELTATNRFNFMFQNEADSLGDPGSWDSRNYTVKVRFSPGTWIMPPIPGKETPGTE